MKRKTYVYVCDCGKKFYVTATMLDNGVTFYTEYAHQPNARSHTEHTYDAILKERGIAKKTEPSFKRCDLEAYNAKHKRAFFARRKRSNA